MTAIANLTQTISQLLAESLVIRPTEALRQARGLISTVSYPFSACFTAGSTAIIDPLTGCDVRCRKFIPMHDGDCRTGGRGTDTHVTPAGVLVYPDGAGLTSSTAPAAARAPVPSSSRGRREMPGCSSGQDHRPGRCRRMHRL